MSWTLAQTFENQVERAIFVASGAHAEQVDKQGRPYILHVLRVGLAGDTEQEQIVGFLHDLLEDTEYTEEDFRQGLRFDQEIVNAVVALTHKKGQTLADYYDQIKANPLALKVKRHDIDDNYNRLETLENIAVRQRLTRKYDWAREVLFGETFNVES